MGRRMTTTDDLWAQAEANGYQRGACTKVDQVRGGQKYISKTKKDHDRTLQRFVHWHLKSMREDHEREGLPPPDEDAARSRYLGEGVPTPDLLTVKDFLRFYVATSKSQLDKQKPTADSICTIAEWFFAGFTRTTGTDTNADDRSEVYYRQTQLILLHWIRRTLVLEGVVVNKHRPKHNFTVRDLSRVLLALWTFDDLIFIPERYRIQVTFLIHVYCWTGARINAFFADGLRYKVCFAVWSLIGSGMLRLSCNVTTTLPTAVAGDSCIRSASVGSKTTETPTTLCTCFPVVRNWPTPLA
ncbi:hypothetical protein A1O1_01320 [Capronia coronata CBS 617.96]|uniref:Uncharacterized protein n=1 Tax=Capronia coronata CBS 617.96 TaxID=1182541 RepID=W9ZNW7_9EURO|nr:uncharacterized protein A1O1_01320 [Capronia coronata CBS 617.96]EXJ96194.1 hypothetical protein A1O1_01320 [Capronia coronata CBS 617.96]